MKKVKAIMGAVVVAGVLSSSVQAAGTSSAQFLKMGAGARAAAMGDAYTAVANDATAAYWNAAGLSQIKAPEISVMQNSGLVETNYQYLGAAMPVGQSAMALSIYRLDYGSIERYTAADARDGSFEAGSLAGAFTFSSPINDAFSYGVTMKYLQESIDGDKGTSFAADAGVLYRTDRFTFGAAVQHVGPGYSLVEEKFDLPATVRMGAATRVLNEKMTLSADLSKAVDNDATVHAGAEYQLTPSFNLRGGYSLTPGNNLDVDGLTGITGGIGAAIHNFNVDYAFLPFGDLGATHRISLSFHFASQN